MSFEERCRCSGVVVALKTRSQLCLYRCSTDAAVQAVLLVIFLLIRELRTTLKPLYSRLGKSGWNTDKRCGYGTSQVLCLVLKGQPLMLNAILDLFSWSSCPPSFDFSFYFYILYIYIYIDWNPEACQMYPRHSWNLQIDFSGYMKYVWDILWNYNSVGWFSDYKAGIILGALKCDRIVLCVGSCLQAVPWCPG